MTRNNNTEKMMALRQKQQLQQPDWLTMEERVRRELGRYRSGLISYAKALRMIDQALAVCTGRGDCLGDKARPWEDDRSVREALDESYSWWDE